VPTDGHAWTWGRGVKNLEKKTADVLCEWPLSQPHDARPKWSEPHDARPGVARRERRGKRSGKPYNAVQKRSPVRFPRCGLNLREVKRTLQNTRGKEEGNIGGKVREE